jgi:hypothetical protein
LDKHELHKNQSSVFLQTSKQFSKIKHKIFRAGKEWTGKKEDKQYIFNEARTLFRKNMEITDKEQIERKLFEAETRLALAVHYKIPQPRLYNVPSGFFLFFNSKRIPTW